MSTLKGMRADGREPDAPAPPENRYARHYRESDYVRFRQEHRSAGSLPVALMAVEQRSHDFVDPPVPELVIAAARAADMHFSWNLGDGWSPPQHVTGGSLHVIPPDTEARIRVQGDQDMLFVSIPRDPSHRLLDAAGLRLADLVPNNTDYFRGPAILRRLEALWRSATLHGPAHVLEADAHLMSVLAMLLERAQQPPPANGTRRRGGLPSRVLARARDLLASSLTEPLSLEALAKEVGVSPFHFCRAFRESMGVPPFRYQQQLRLERAVHLLQCTDVPVIDIAFEVGYESPQALARAFRQHTGMSPLELRRQRTLA